MKDFQTDAVQRPIVKAAAAGLLPDWLMATPFPEKREFTKLASAAFADPANRLLPTNSKACVLWSATYAGAHPDWYSPGSQDSIKAAAAVFGVVDEVEKLLAFRDALETKQASAAPTTVKSAFALTLEDGAAFGLSEGPVNLLPCHDEFHIDGSAESLNKAARDNTMPPELVYMAAVELVKAASKAGCLDVLPRAVAAAGTERMVDWNRAEILLSDRLKMAGDSFFGYGEIVKLGQANPEQTDMLIDGLRDLDAALGFTYWGSKASNVISPWEAVYSGPTMETIEKMAQTHAVLAGALVPMDALVSLSDTEVDRLFGKEAGEIIKSAKVADDNAGATNLLSQLGADVQERLFVALAK